MSIAQYVGARYVPKFYEGVGGSNDWVQGIAYEPLTIVTFAGNSFTSKRQVPASIGSPNLNPEYWASTGIYNAQIDEYREETAEALQTALDAQEDVQTLSGQVDTALGAMRDEIEPLTTSYDAIYVVGKNNEGQYSTIASALNAALQTPNKRTAIIVFSGIYEETLDYHSYTPADLTIMGVGTVLIRSSASWPNGPMYISAGTWVFDNIKMANLNATGEHGGYALHADPVLGNLICRDCEFTSNTNAGAGVGMGANGTAIFDNCMFHTSVDHAFYLHNRALPDQNNQTVVLNQCRFEGQNNKPCVRIDDAAKLAGYTGSVCGVSVYNCTGYLTPKVQFRKTPSTTLEYLDTDYTGIFLQTTSYSPGIPGLTYTTSQTPTGINSKCNVNNINYCRCGNIVNVNIDFTANGNFSNNEKIIEDGIPIPANTVTSTLNSFEADSSGAFVQITAGVGSITSFGIVSGKRYVGSLTYICKYY